MQPPRVMLEPSAYSAWCETRLGGRAWSDEERTLHEALAPAREWHVLDAGCDDGRHISSLTHKVRLASGVDASEEMLPAARRRLVRPRGRVVVGRITTVGAAIIVAAAVKPERTSPADTPHTGRQS